MNLARLLGILVVVWLLYVIIGNPVGAAGMTHGILADLHSAGDSMITFVDGVVRH
jgi:hypothetical protein